MGLRLNVPLPGPFVYSARIGGGRGSRAAGQGFAALIYLSAMVMVWAVMAAVWVVVALCIVVFELVKLAAPPVERWWRNRHGATVEPEQPAPEPESASEAERRARWYESLDLPESAAATREAAGIDPDAPPQVVTPLVPGQRVDDATRAAMSAGRSPQEAAALIAKYEEHLKRRDEGLVDFRRLRPGDSVPPPVTRGVFKP